MSIPGGYYLKARKARTSWIAHAAPCTREVWDWLLCEANHKDNEVCLRGQLIRTYDDIREGLSWFVGYRKMAYSKWACEGALKALLKATMVTTTKTTRGLLITICKYETYQTPENYEHHSEDHTNTTMTPQPSSTINKNVRMEEGKNNTPPIAPQGAENVEKSWTPEETAFEEARIAYPGTKRGHDTEWLNFRKKCKDWKELAPVLLDAIRLLEASRSATKARSEFVPPWANFTTWINQRKFEECLA